MVADPQLVQYILQNHQKGYDINTLRNSLVKQGYQPNVVEEAITAATQQGQVTPQKLPVGKTHSNMILLISVVLVGLIGIAGFGLFFMAGEEEESDEPFAFGEESTFAGFDESGFEDENEIIEEEPEIQIAGTVNQTTINQTSVNITIGNQTSPTPDNQTVLPIVNQTQPDVPIDITGLGADELKLEVLRQNKKIQSYSFTQDIETIIGDESFAIENEGIVDRKDKKIEGSFDGMDVFIQNNVVYTQMDGTWVKEGLIFEEEYFLLDYQIEILKTSDIGILNKDPLEILTLLNKVFIGEDMARELFYDQTDFFDDYTIDYENALTIDVVLSLNDDLYIQNINYEATLNVNNGTAIPKNGQDFDQNLNMSRNSQTKFMNFDNIGDIVVDDSIVFDSITLSEFEDQVVNVTMPDINMTDDNQTINNQTGNNSS